MYFEQFCVAQCGLIVSAAAINPWHKSLLPVSLLTAFLMGEKGISYIAAIKENRLSLFLTNLLVVKILLELQ